MPGADVGGLLRSTVAALCLAAGVLHLSAAADHRGMASHVAFFLLVAVGQSALAPVVVWAGRPGRWLAVSAGANLAIVAVWAFSRTTGLPVDGSSAVEAIGFKDGITTLLELGAVAGAGFWWLLPEASRHIALESRRLATVMLGTGVWVFGAGGLFAGHTHSAGHTHDGGHSAAAHSHGGEAGQVAAEAGDDHHGDHDGDHPHPAGTVSAELAAAPHLHEHDHASEQAGDPGATALEAAAHHHGPGLRPVTGAGPAGSHDHADVLDARQAAGHRHGDAATDAPEPGASDSEAGGHSHDHAAGPAHDHDSGGTDRPDDQEDGDRKDENGGSSPLDAILKLIQPR